MKNIAEDLSAAMGKTNAADKLDVIVTTNGELPKGYNLQSFNGLDGLYHGKLGHDQIKALAAHPNVKAVELDNENTTL